MCRVGQEGVPLLVDEEKSLLPQLSPLVLGDACGHLSGAAGSTLEGDQGFPVSPAAGSLQTTCSAGMLLCVTIYTSWCLGLKSDFVFPELLLQYCSGHWVKHTDNTMDHLFKWCAAHLYLPAIAVELL